MITLSDRAVTKLTEIMASDPDAKDLALRVAVRPGGCSGYSYEMFFDSDTTADDETATFGESGVRVVVDPASAQLLDGARLEFDDGLNGKGFSVTNPNATRSCGCGQSFS